MRTAILILGYFAIETIATHYGIKFDSPANLVLMVIGLFTTISCDFVAADKKIKSSRKGDDDLPVESLIIPPTDHHGR